MRLFDKLNSPKVVLFVLALILAVNGFLLYRQPATPTATNQPRTEIIVVPANSAPEAPEIAKRPKKAEPEQGSQTQERTEERTQERTQEPTQEPTKTDPEQDPPQVPEKTTQVELGGLGEAMGGCDREAEECLREFVATAAPEAKYIGGRTDLETGRDSEVLYFETPALSECEHVRQTYQSAGETTYTVIVIGQGSFQSPRGPECIPKA